MENKTANFKSEELFNIIMENTQNILNEFAEQDNFPMAIKKIYKLVREEGFPDMIDDIANDIYAFSNGEGMFVYNEDSMYELLRDLVNYDLICINDTEDAISVEDSNNEDVAKLIQPYVNPQMCQTIAQSF